MKIFRVQENSVCDELGIRAGDELVALGGQAVCDILDYEYYSGEESFVMTVLKGGQLTEFEIEKYADEALGLEFEDELSVIKCQNKCMFCFVDQLPKTRLRDTLRVKDDDYRLSFISGSFVTMTNMDEDDIERIKRLGLSPIYISVHTTNHELRLKMLGRKNAPNIMEQIRSLSGAGIEIHAQIVYCPGINEDVLNSINELAPHCKSLAIVPVGLTKDCNPSLKTVDSFAAKRLINIVEDCQQEFLKSKGTRFVFAADELYLKAEAELPRFDEYEDFAQIENGVGLLAQFENDFDYAIEEYKSDSHEKQADKNRKYPPCSIATGSSAYNFISQKVQKISEITGRKIDVFRIDNNFFGATVTVAGLVVGSDILAALIGKDLGETLYIPSTMLKEFGNVFLDDMTRDELAKKLNVRVKSIAPNGEAFATELLKP